MAQELRAHQTADIPVELAFLEFMEPSLVNAAESLLRRGIQHLDVIPLFLGAGGHVRKDLPGLIDALKSDHPDLQVVLHPAVGESPLVVTAMAQAALGFAALP